jgi:LPPG:FO 2-phospho-L-lactate transferase
MIVERDSACVLALAGGVGGAKLALGLSRLLSPAALTVVVNTGDDEVFHGLHVSPDLDTVMYTLAGIQNPETGWGLFAESFAALTMLEELGGETWFRLGDRDLGTHLRRTELLGMGRTLSEVTAELCRHLGVACTVVPMTDDRVRTFAIAEGGELAFQDYFVRLRCEPRLRGVQFDGAETAAASPGFRSALASATVIVFCPSNPFVSIDPILSIGGIRDQVKGFRGKRVAVSPIIGGEAVKGPAAKMFVELGAEPSALAVARRYRGLCDVFVLDAVDAELAADVAELGMEPLVAQTLMLDDAAKVELAREVLRAAGVGV